MIKTIEHPLLAHKLGYLRDKETKSLEFRTLVKEISELLAYEVMRGWSDIQQVHIETPLQKTKVDRILSTPVVISIMRAGNGMLDGVLNVLPFASTGFIGIYRDKFIHSTVEYYFKMPQEVKGKTALICDPLIATGDTMCAALERLKSYGVKDMKILSILMSQEAVDRLNKLYPEVDIYTLHIEKEMNSEGYLLPGLGDAGDRLYQTK